MIKVTRKVRADLRRRLAAGMAEMVADATELQIHRAVAALDDPRNAWSCPTMAALFRLVYANKPHKSPVLNDRPVYDMRHAPVA